VVEDSTASGLPTLFCSGSAPDAKLISNSPTAIVSDRKTRRTLAKTLTGNFCCQGVFPFDRLINFLHSELDFESIPMSARLRPCSRRCIRRPGVPATSPATPATSTAFCVALAAATPMIRLAVETMPSLAPNTAARSQPIRSLRWLPVWSLDIKSLINRAVRSAERPGDGDLARLRAASGTRRECPHAGCSRAPGRTARRCRSLPAHQPGMPHARS